MKKFRVYKHPVLGLKAIKLGFSWPAFFFGFFWILYQRLWGVLLLWFACYFVYLAGGSIFIFLAGLIWLAVKQKWGTFALWTSISVIAFIIDALSSAKFSSMGNSPMPSFNIFTMISAFFVFAFILAVGGNEWIEKNLLKRGFKLVEETEAETSDAALAKVLNENY